MAEMAAMLYCDAVVVSSAARTLIMLFAKAENVCIAAWRLPNCDGKYALSGRHFMSHYALSGLPIHGFKGWLSRGILATTF